MADDGWLCTSLTALGVLGAAEVPFDKALILVPEVAIWAVEEAEGGAITWLVNEGSPVHAASHAFAGYLDQEQFDCGKGPSPRALAERRVVTGRVVSEDRWSNRASGGGDRVKAHRAVLAAPLALDDKPLGVLSLYSAPSRAFSDSVVAGASMFAQHAGHWLRTTQSHDELRSRVTELDEALAARRVLDRAKAFLMAGRECACDEALEYLRKVSQRTNVSLFELATRLVNSFDSRARQSQPPQARD